MPRRRSGAEADWVQPVPYEWVRSRAIELTLYNCVPPSNGASGVSTLTSTQHGAPAEQSCFSSTPGGTLSTHRRTHPAVSSSFWPSSTACTSSGPGAGAPATSGSHAGVSVLPVQVVERTGRLVGFVT